MRRSLTWVEATVRAARLQEQAYEAELLVGVALAAAAPNTEESVEAFKNFIDELLGTSESTDSWITNPDAQTDVEAVHAATWADGTPMFTRQQREEVTDG
jgi:2-keto-4-pentenoate hydratase